MTVHSCTHIYSSHITNTPQQNVGYTLKKWFSRLINNNKPFVVVRPIFNDFWWKVVRCSNARLCKFNSAEYSNINTTIAMQHFIHGDVCYLNEYLNAYSYRAEVIYLENISNKQWLYYLKVSGGSWNSTFPPLPFTPIFSLLSSSLFPFPPFPPLRSRLLKSS